MVLKVYLYNMKQYKKCKWEIVIQQHFIVDICKDKDFLLFYRAFGPFGWHSKLSFYSYLQIIANGDVYGSIKSCYIHLPLLRNSLHCFHFLRCLIILHLYCFLNWVFPFTCRLLPTLLLQFRRSCIFRDQI